MHETRVKNNVIGLETERVQAFKNSNEVLLAKMIWEEGRDTVSKGTWFEYT